MLAEHPDGLAEVELAAAVAAAAADRPDGWFPALLARLETEGLVARDAEGRLHLPPA